MVDADPAGKSSPPIRPGQLPGVVGIKAERVVGIVSERMVAITLDQVVAIKSEWVVGSSRNPHVVTPITPHLRPRLTKGRGYAHGSPLLRLTAKLFDSMLQDSWSRHPAI